MGPDPTGHHGFTKVVSQRAKIRILEHHDVPSDTHAKGPAREGQNAFWNSGIPYDLKGRGDGSYRTGLSRGLLAVMETYELQEEILSPGKAISTPEEISLLAQVLNSTGRTEETVKLLQGVALNMDSRIGQQDPQLVLSLLLEALDSSQKWDEALPLCQRLLSKPVHQSDDRIWNLWLRALPESSVDRYV